MATEIKSYDPVKKRKFQNMTRHVDMIDQLITLMMKLKDKMFYYRDLYQEIVNFMIECCVNNPIVQKHLLKDLSFFVDMINQRIETGQLISEIIKSNVDQERSQIFIDYLVNKIINQGYFKSTLFYLLLKLANNQNDVQTDNKIKRNENKEQSNQQFIMKQIVKNYRFRSIIYMKKEYTATKLGIIKAYVRRLDQ